MMNYGLLNLLTIILQIVIAIVAYFAYFRKFKPGSELYIRMKLRGFRVLYIVLVIASIGSPYISRLLYSLGIHI